MKDKLNSVLPQTQCRECTYDGCMPYAKAMASGEAGINLCPPGGVTTLRALGNLLGVDPTPFEASRKADTRPPAIARIREDECIGCTKCIQACPVDAIIGRNKFMHSVMEVECTGCRLCVEPCPVDCIDIIEIESPTFDTLLAEHRYNQRNARLKKIEQKKREDYQDTRQLAATSDDDAAAKKAYIQAAMARKFKQK